MWIFKNFGHTRLNNRGPAVYYLIFTTQVGRKFPEYIHQCTLHTLLHRQNIFHVLWHPLNFFCFKVQKSFWLRPTTKPWKMSRYFPKNWSLLLVLCCRSFWTQHLDFEEISFRPPTRVSIQTVSQKWLISAKKKSLFRSLCSTFNDLEKFNELKTLNPYIYNTFSFNFFKNLFTHCAILLLKNNMELIEEETAWNNCSIILIPFNRRVTSNSNDSTKMLICSLGLWEII